MGRPGWLGWQGQPLSVLPRVPLASPGLVALGLYPLRLRVVAPVWVRSLRPAALPPGPDPVTP